VATTFSILNVHLPTTVPTTVVPTVQVVLNKKIKVQELKKGFLGQVGKGGLYIFERIILNGMCLRDGFQKGGGSRGVIIVDVSRVAIENAIKGRRETRLGSVKFCTSTE